MKPSIGPLAIVCAFIFLLPINLTADHRANFNPFDINYVEMGASSMLGANIVSNYAGSSFFFGEGNLWNSVSEASGAPDSIAAFSGLFPNDTSRYLYVRDFGFNIPCNATITDLTFRIYRQNSGTIDIQDALVSVYNPNTLSAGALNLKDPNLWVEGGVNWETITYSHANWGETLTPELINNARFGLLVQTEQLENAGLTNARIDAIEMVVCYNVGVPYTQPISFITNKIDACFNEGEINISAIGGSGSYEYSIDDGVNWQTSGNFTGLALGDYIIIVRNTDGTCETERFYCNLSGDDRILQAGDAIVACATFPGNRVTLAIEKLQPMNDLYNMGETGYDISFLLPFHPFEWDVDDLGGEVFSFDIDRTRNIYTATTKMYDLVPGVVVNPIVSKIDAFTGDVTMLTTLPGDGGATSVEYDTICEQLFVGNLSDGMIYRLDPSTGATLSTFDPGVADNGAAGIAPLGERILGLGFNPQDGRLYYSVWNSDFDKNGTPNVIRSVAIDPGTCDFLPASDRLEITIPWTQTYGDPLNPDQYSMPVSDIEFSADGLTMLMGESGFDSTVPNSKPHESRVLQYIYDGINWILQTTVPPGNTNLKHELGEVSAGLNARGGVDFSNAGFDAFGCSIDDDTFIIATADALRGADCNTLGCLYGLQYLPIAGGNSMGSVLLDIARDPGSQQKGVFGDVDIIKGCFESLICCPEISSPAPDESVCEGASLTGVSVTSQADSMAIVYHTTIPADSAAVYASGTPFDTIDIIANAGTFDMSGFPINTPGTYYVYTIAHPTPAEDYCRPYDSLVIEIFANPTPTITDPSDECINGSDMNFTGSPLPGGGTTGTFSTDAPAGLTDNLNGTATLDVGAAAAGIYDVTYTYTDINGCQDAETVSVQVWDTLQPVDLSTADICGNPVFGTNFIDLNSLINSGPLGGSWADTDGSGGLAGSVFTANIAMEGNSYTFTYTITGPGPIGTACQTRSFTTVINVVYCNLDLALIKTTSQVNPVQPNDVVTYDITICNQGFTIADSIVVTDYLAPCYGFVPNNNWITNGPNAEITLTINNGLLPAGGLPTPASAPNNCITIPLDVTVVCGDPSQLITYAEISASRDTDGNTGDIDSNPGSNNALENSVLPGDPDDDSFTDINEDDHDPATMPLADVALILTAVTPPPYSYGQPVTFNIQVTNQGNIDLAGVQITNYVPCGLSFNPLNNGLWTPNGTTPFTTIASLDVGRTTNVTIELDVIESPALCTNVTSWLNEAEVSQIFDDFGNDWSLFDYDSKSNTILGDDAGGAAGTGSDDSIIGDGTGAPGDPFAATDEDDHDPALLAVYDLAITKAVTSSGPYGQDSIVSYILTVENQGGITANNFQVSEVPNAGLVYVGSDAGGNANVNELAPGLWEVISLDPELTETINVTYTIASNFQALDLTNEVQITLDDGDDADSDPSTDNTVDEDGDGNGDDDDEDEATIMIDQFYDLAIAKNEITTGPYFQNSFITYELVVTNEGTLDAANIQFIDMPAADLIFVGDDAAGNPNVNALGGMVYEIIDLDFGFSESVQLTFQVNPLYQGTTILNGTQITLDDGDDVDSDPSR